MHYCGFCPCDGKRNFFVTWSNYLHDPINSKDKTNESCWHTHSFKTQNGVGQSCTWGPWSTSWQKYSNQTRRVGESIQQVKIWPVEIIRMSGHYRQMVNRIRISAMRVNNNNYGYRWPLLKIIHVFADLYSFRIVAMRVCELKMGKFVTIRGWYLHSCIWV